MKNSSPVSWEGWFVDGTPGGYVERRPLLLSERALGALDDEVLPITFSTAENSVRVMLGAAG